MIERFMVGLLRVHHPYLAELESVPFTAGPRCGRRAVTACSCNLPTPWGDPSVAREVGTSTDPGFNAERSIMAIELPDLNFRFGGKRRAELSTDDVGPAIERAGKTLRDWRQSTESALEALSDLSLDSMPKLPKVSMSSLPRISVERSRPSAIRRGAPFLALGIVGLIAGLAIGWWMATMNGTGTATATKRGASPKNAPDMPERHVDDMPAAVGTSDDAWAHPGGMDRSPSPDEMKSESWRSVGPGSTADNGADAADLAGVSARER
jgi:hypothetical protein